MANPKQPSALGEAPDRSCTELDTPPVEDAISDDTIWRYMDLPKFISMLASGGLWFVKAATLRDDPYEGFCKAEHLETPSEDHGRRVIRQSNIEGETLVSVGQMLARLSRHSADICGNARDHLYVNSWCLHAQESMAMWQIYGSFGCGLAVKSSVNQYRRAARFEIPSSSYAFGKVKYHSDLESSPDIQRNFVEEIPLSSNLWNEVLKLGFHKRSCYEYENEWRAAVYQDARPETAGVLASFDLEELISAVYVGPRAEAFLFDAVQAILDKFLLRKPLEPSLLLSPPSKESASAAASSATT